jgi:hypothetical protein
MKKTNPFEEASSSLKGLMDEFKLQAHLGQMELEESAGPVVEEVRAATKDIVERSKQLQQRLKTLREQRRS